MPGEPDLLLVLARRALLDVLDAIGTHRQAVILVGAQAIYVHTGAADLAVAEFTTDADLAIDPSRLAPVPDLGGELLRAGFVREEQPGIWHTTYRVAEHDVVVPVDFLVAEAVGGGGRRGARLGAHGATVARKAKGLEASLVDNDLRTIPSLGSDPRSVDIRVAGPAALLVAKLHKIGERAGRADRVVDKDALDVYRLLLAVPADVMARGIERCRREQVSAQITREALSYFDDLFSRPDARGTQMIASSTASIAVTETTVASSVVLSQELLRVLQE